MFQVQVHDGYVCALTCLAFALIVSHALILLSVRISPVRKGMSHGPRTGAAEHAWRSQRLPMWIGGHLGTLDSFSNRRPRRQSPPPVERISESIRSRPTFDAGMLSPAHTPEQENSVIGHSPHLSKDLPCHLIQLHPERSRHVENPSVSNPLVNKDQRDRYRNAGARAHLGSGGHSPSAITTGTHHCLGRITKCTARQ